MAHSMELNTINDLFVEELKDMYGAEQQIIEAMPKMIDAASSPELKQKFQKHLQETRDQVNKLQQVFGRLNIPVEAEECEGMEGIIEDGEKAIEAQGDPNVKDAALVAAAQKVEHYEITSYGTLRALANTLGRDDVAKELGSILRQESMTDEILTQFATRSVNVQSPQA